MTCSHRGSIERVTPSALGCEDCLKSGGRWVHLRLCRTCGHVGCCDSSPGRHATAHFRATGHPIIEGYDPPEGWGWCYVTRSRSTCRTRHLSVARSRVSCDRRLTVEEEREHAGERNLASDWHPVQATDAKGGFVRQT